MNFKTVTLYSLLFGTLITSLWPNNIYLLFTFSVACWGLLPFKRRWTKTAVALLLFSVFYFLVQQVNGNATDSKFIQGAYIFSPLAFYWFGYDLFNRYQNDNSRQKILLIILFLYLLPLFRATFIDMALVGFINETRQLLSDMSGNNGTLAATLYGLMSSTGIGCIGVLFLKKQPLLYKISFLVVCLLCLLAVVHLVNRTGIVILVGSILIGFIASTKMNISKLIPALFIGMLFVLVLLNSGIVSQDILEAYMARENDSSYDASSAGGRTEAWLAGLENLFIYPFGWVTEHYHHNLWLDLAKVGGWLAFIPFCYVTLQFFKSWMNVIRFNTSSTGVMIVAVSFSSLLNACVEPTIEGSMLFFSLLMMYWGMIKRISLETYK